MKSIFLPLISLVFIIVTSALLFLLNLWQPLACDDYIYCFICTQEGRVESLTDIFVSQWHHWNACNGRFVAHCFAQFFLMQNKMLFNVANVLVLLCVAWIIAGLFSDKNHQNKLVPTAIILALLLVLMPDKGVTLIWLTGSCNYLWSILLVCVYLILYFSKKDKLLILSLLVAPMAGNAHEGISIGLVAFVLMHIVLRIFLRKKTPVILYVSVCLLIAGLAFNLISPGLTHRLPSGGEKSMWELLEPPYHAFLRMGSSLVREHIGSSYFYILLPNLLGVTLVLIRWRRGFDQQNSLAILFLLASLLQAVAVSFSKLYYERVFIGVFLFGFFSCCVFWVPLIQHVSSKWQMVVLLPVCTITCWCLSMSIPGARANVSQSAHIIARARAGENIVYITDAPPKLKYGLSSVAYWGFWSNSHRMKRAIQYLGASPFALFGQEEHKRLMSFAAEMLRAAEAGAIVANGDGDVVFSVPLDTERIRVAEVTSQNGSIIDDANVKQPEMVWPSAGKYLALFKHSQSCHQLIIEYRNKRGQRRVIYLREAELELLRNNKIIPAERIKHQIGENVLPEQWELNFDG